MLKTFAGVVTLILTLGITYNKFIKSEEEVQETKLGNSKLIKEIDEAHKNSTRNKCLFEHQLLDKEIQTIKEKILRLRTEINENRLKRIECNYGLSVCEEFLTGCEDSLLKSVNNVCENFMPEHQQSLKDYTYSKRV